MNNEFAKILEKDPTSAGLFKNFSHPKQKNLY